MDQTTSSTFAGAAQGAAAGATTGIAIGAAASGVAAGAATGAAAGSVVPVVGTIVGAVVGAALGYLAGDAGSRYTMHMKKAKYYEKQLKYREAAVMRRDAVREFRANRAMQVAGMYAEGQQGSSSPRAGASSYGSQFAGNMDLFDWTVGTQALVSKQRKRANKSARDADMYSAALKATLQLGTAIGGYYGAAQAGKAQFASTMMAGGNEAARWAPGVAGPVGQPFAGNASGSQSWNTFYTMPQFNTGG